MSWLLRHRRTLKRKRDYTATSPPSLCSASSRFRLLPLLDLHLYWLATRVDSPPPLRLKFGFSPSPSSPPLSLSLASLSSLLCSVSSVTSQWFRPAWWCCSESCRGNCRYQKKDPRGRNIHRYLLRCCISGEYIPRPPPLASRLPLLLARFARPATAACPAWRGNSAFRGQAQLFPASLPPLPRC